MDRTLVLKIQCGKVRVSSRSEIKLGFIHVFLDQLSFCYNKSKKKINLGQFDIDMQPAAGPDT